MVNTRHTPVLVNQAMQYLINDPRGVYVDATLGTGGHLQAMSEHLDHRATLIGLDADPQAIQYCQKTLDLPQKSFLVNTNFRHLKKYCFRLGYPKVNGILMDLGLSSFALDNPQRGFSYDKAGPLDMRFSPEIKTDARELINTASPQQLKEIFSSYGEEKKAGKLARLISQARAAQSITTTTQLAAIIKKTVPPPYQRKTLSRIFQALRIYINRELEALDAALSQVPGLLSARDRLVIITYHSLEDRRVKQFMKKESQTCICPPEFPVCRCDHQPTLEVLTARPLIPTEQEIASNPRSRSAKLRAAAKI